MITVRSSDFMKRSGVKLYRDLSPKLLDTLHFIPLLEVTNFVRSSDFMQCSVMKLYRDQYYNFSIRFISFRYSKWRMSSGRVILWSAAEGNCIETITKAARYASFHYTTRSEGLRQVEWFYGARRKKIVSRPSLNLLETIHCISLLEVTDVVSSSGYMQRSVMKLYRDHKINQ